MEAMNIYYPIYEFSESLQSIVNGLKSERLPPSCLQCRKKGPSDQGDGSSASSSSSSPAVKPLVRCSRCQVAYYCNAACQKKHFDYHKQSCKTIHEKRTAVLAHWHLCGPKASSMTHLKVLTSMLYMANELVVMGYNESDTFENGRVHFRKALFWYLEANELWRLTSLEPPNISLENKILLLLVLLGANAAHIKEWCVSSGGSRAINFGPPMVAAPEEFQTHGLASKDTAFQCFSLFVAMSSLAQYRRDNEAFQSFKSIFTSATTSRHAELEPLSSLLETLILPFLLGNAEADGTWHVDSLPAEIRLLIRTMEYHIYKPYLVHLRRLRDDMTLAPQLHFPDLFPTDSDRDTVLGPFKHTPQAFWNLFHDAFFTTPGVIDVLHEFVPAEYDDVTNWMEYDDYLKWGHRLR